MSWRGLIAALLLGNMAAASAQVQRAIASIEFAGNEVTQPTTMLRELPFEPGDLIQPGMLEVGRQSIMNLGLFKSVQTLKSRSSLGEHILYVVQEKHFLLPVPRLEYSSDRELRYGMKLRWNNIQGLNQTMTLFWLIKQPDDKTKPDARRYAFSYRYPLVRGTPYEFSFELGFVDTSFDDERLGGLREDINEEQQYLDLLVGRSLNFFPSVQGWHAGSGLYWRRDRWNGAEAPESPGSAAALILFASYDGRDRLDYSDMGSLARIRLESAKRSVLADYSYSRLEAEYERSRPLGWKAHQSLRWELALGAYLGGREYRREFRLGGRDSLRGYDKGEFAGDAYYLGRVEWLSPIGRWQSLRGMLIFDMGNTFDELSDAHLNRVPANIGAGLRWRLRAFVDLELELGFAIPLDGGEIHLFGGNAK